MKQKFTLGFIFDYECRSVLLVKKNRGPKNVEKMAGKLNGIGGHLEIGEIPLDCIRRECEEETGLKIKYWHCFCILNAEFGEVYCFYAVTDKIFNYKQMEDEELNIYSCYYIIRDLFYMEYERMPNLDWLIPMALNHHSKLDSAKRFYVKEVVK